jgi:hypothetical protein
MMSKSGEKDQRRRGPTGEKKVVLANKVVLDHYGKKVVLENEGPSRGYNGQMEETRVMTVNKVVKVKRGVQGAGTLWKERRTVWRM